MSSVHIDNLEELKQLIFNNRIETVDAYNKLLEILERCNKYIKEVSRGLLDGYVVGEDILYRFNGNTNVRVKNKRLVQDIDKLIKVVKEYTVI